MGTLAPRLAVFFLLLGHLLAGCIGETEAPEDGTGEVVETTDRTGAIRGTVATDLFMPLSGVAVALLGADREPTGLEATTDEDGGFLFSQLEPDRYVVYVQIPGHSTAVQGADVEAGTVTNVQVQVRPLPRDSPWVEEIDVVGLIAGQVAYQVEVPGQGCIHEDLVGVGTCGTRTVLPNSENQMTALIPDDRVKTILVEVAWDPAGPLGEFLQVQMFCQGVARASSTGNPNDYNDPCWFQVSGNDSPLVIRIDEEYWLEHDINVTEEWRIRVFSGYGMLGTYPLLGSDAGATYQQTFTKYITVFHRDGGPEEFRRSPDS